MTSSEAGGRAEYEFRLIKGVMVGVPSSSGLVPFYRYFINFRREYT